jgi:glycine/D-amino acid oxidase-like deaminating enzyme
MRAAEAHGAELRLGQVTGVVRGRGGVRVEGVAVEGETIAGDAVVIAMGPWSILASGWLPLAGVYGLKGHSLVFETGARVPAEALFLECEAVPGEVQSPEVFLRPDGTTYVCGLSSESPLPVDPTDVAPDPGAIERLRDVCGRMLPVLAESEIVARQACYRPVTRDGLPLIGPVPGVEGAYVATGHSVWDILNAPATGEAMAELITDGAEQSVDLSRFDPGRLPPLDPARLRAGADAKSLPSATWPSHVGVRIAQDGRVCESLWSSDPLLPCEPRRRARLRLLGLDNPVARRCGRLKRIEKPASRM